MAHARMLARSLLPLGLVLSCGQLPATTGTTRLCPAEAAGAPMCFRFCTDVEAPMCTVADETGAVVPECARDDVADAYLFVDGAYVTPAGATRCFVLLGDPAAATADPNDGLPAECATDDLDLGVIIVDGSGMPFPDDACFDVRCAIRDCE